MRTVRSSLARSARSTGRYALWRVRPRRGDSSSQSGINLAWAIKNAETSIAWGGSISLFATAERNGE